MTGENKKDEIEISDESKKSGSFWTVSLIVVISLTRIGHGLFFSLSGPTLLYLTENVNATVSQVSSMFTGRSAGFFVGTIIFGIIKNRFESHKPLKIIAIGIALGGVLMLITPWVTDLAWLVVITTITGIMFGYFDAGLQSLYLQLWGEKKSRPYIQSFHFMFGVGAFLAPVVASPFLQMANQEESADESCPSNGDGTFTTVSYNASDEVSTVPPYTGLNPVAWTYVMSGGFTIVIGIIMLLFAFLRIEDRVKDSNEESKEERTEEPIRDVVWLFIPVFIYYFMSSSIEAVYQSYIYSVALCSEVSFSVSDASSLNTLFWVGFTVGRGSGIFYANYFKPSTIIIVDMIATTSAMIIISIFGSYIPLVVWLVTVFQGLAVATLYPTGISWTSQYTNVSATYILLFGAGNTVGTMTMLPLGGFLFDMNPFNVVYQICAMAVCNNLAFVWMTWIGRKHLRRKIKTASMHDVTSFVDEQELKTRI